MTQCSLCGLATWLIFLMVDRDEHLVFCGRVMHLFDRKFSPLIIFVLKGQR